MKKTVFSVALVIIVFFVGAVAVFAGGPDPFEQAMAKGIEKPDQSVPENIRVFSGVWKGDSESCTRLGACHRYRDSSWLIVHQISGNTAKVSCCLQGMNGIYTAYEASGEFLKGETVELTVPILIKKAGNSYTMDFKLKQKKERLYGQMDTITVDLNRVEP